MRFEKGLVEKVSFFFPLFSSLLLYSLVSMTNDEVRTPSLFSSPPPQASQKLGVSDKLFFSFCIAPVADKHVFFPSPPLPPYLPGERDQDDE